MGKRIIAMIPARLGSTRVKRKNLRLINGKPLISFIIESAIKAKIFNEIIINSESNIFKEIAEDNKVKFYKRPEYLASDEVTNDLFAKDFLEKNETDILIQLLPTSPFIEPEDIRGFVDTMIKGGYETLISVKNEQIESIFESKPINFDPLKITPLSQDLRPVHCYACGIMGWEKDRYLKNMDKFGAGYHGGDGRTGYYVLKGFSTIDIDQEEDFELARAIAKMKGMPRIPPRYYEAKDERKEHGETDVYSILDIDGIKEIDLFDANKPLINIDEIIASNPKDSSWCKRVVNTENNLASLICQQPGEGNRLHYHDDWNEWWYIVDGRWRFEIEGEAHNVSKGDLVFIEKNKLHKITAIGDKPATRLAVSIDEMVHIYPNE